MMDATQDHRQPRALVGAASVSTRRGATLVLVLGALSLISILTIVYVSVGRADRRTSAAAAESSERGVNVERFVDHIAGVIADDVTATYIESASAENVARFAREAVDLPRTSPGMMSVVPSSEASFSGDRAVELDRHRFRPSGTVTRAWSDPSGDVRSFFNDVRSASNNVRLVELDYRSISDPFLAQTLPTDIDGDAVFNSTSGAQAAGLIYAEARDWGHLSNFAPDGRYVNLYNLRGDADYGSVNNPWDGPLGGRQGGFDAPSGFSIGGPFDLEAQLDDDAEVRDRLAISDGLTLWEPRVRVDDPWLASATYRSPGDQAGASDVDLTAGGNQSLINLPYIWSTNQRELFRPAQNLPDDPGWNDPTYWAYQYADADGDGFLDSRWQELVDATDARDIRDLAGGGDLRLFFAARAIDLSSLVNVNTAADFTASPLAADGNPANGMAERIGASPAEVDLRRILSMEDVWFDVARSAVGSRGYGSHVQPFDLPGGEVDDPGNYGNYQPLVANNNSLIRSAMFNGARGGVAAIRRTLLDGVLPPSGPDAELEYQFDPNTANMLSQLSEPDVGLFSRVVSPYESISNPSAADTPTLGLGSRVDGYRRIGANEPGANAGGSGASTLFGVDDLGELLAFWGANDDALTSRLEAAVGGRGNNLNAVGDAYHLSPLRSDRPLSLELTRGDWDADGRYSVNEAERDLFWSLFNSRRYLTTLSGARPLTGDLPISIGGSIDRSLTSTLGAGDVRRVLGQPPSTTAPEFIGYVESIFSVYRDMLLPYEAEDNGNAWLGDTASALGGFPRQTESYGYQGPALAARLAAHLTANRIDMIDTDAGRTAVRLRPNGSIGTAVFPGEVDVSALLAPEAIDAASLGVVEDVVVFGAEAQPFLVEAVSMNVFVDTPFSNGGDQDWDPTDMGGADGLSFSGVVTIDSAIDRSNPDFLFQVFAVQISNPFESTVSLQDLYIEFADQLFTLEAAPDLGPNETIFAYTTTPEDLENTSMVTRVEASTGVAFDLESWLNAKLSGSTSPLVRLERVADASGASPFLVSSAPEDFPADRLSDAPDLEEVHDLFSSTIPGSLETVMLWRTNGASRLSHVLLDRLSESSGSATLDTRPDFGADRTNGDGVAVAPTATGTTGSITGLFQQGLDSNADPAEVYSIAFAGSIVRPSGAAPVGGLPAWAIEVKPGSQASQGSRNTSQPSAVTPSLPDAAVVNSAIGTLVEADTLTNGLDNLTLIGTLAELPDSKSTPSIDAAAVVNRPAFNERYLELAIDGQRAAQRTGDLLLPLGVGAFFKEGSSTAGTRVDMLADEWTTLGEALGIALGYGSLVSPNSSLSDSLDGIGGLNSANAFVEQNAVLDNGRLFLDRFVLFTDSGFPGAFDQIFNPDLSSPLTTTGRFNEQTRGLAVPAALRVFSLVSAADELDPLQYGSVDRPMMGMVNLNTAPLAVLRTLPTMTPALSVSEGQGFAPTYDHWFAKRQQDALAVPPIPAANWPGAFPVTTTLDAANAVDIASMLVGFRDRTLVFNRPISAPGVAVLPGNAAGTPEINDFSRVPGVFPVEQDELFAHPAALSGRFDGLSSDLSSVATRAGIRGLREGSGLHSLGEIFGARIEDDPATAPGTDEQYYQTVRGIDGYSRDGANMNVVRGVDAVSYTDPVVPGSLLDDAIDDDYAEQLVVLNALANTASVRSDYYAVWLVVQGYRETDVSGLQPTEPLIPSLRDRYLLVFDRSNVTEAGDAPRLVYRKQLRN